MHVRIMVKEMIRLHAFPPLGHKNIMFFYLDFFLLLFCLFKCAKTQFVGWAIHIVHLKRQIHGNFNAE